MSSRDTDDGRWRIARSRPAEEAEGRVDRYELRGTDDDRPTVLVDRPDGVRAFGPRAEEGVDLLRGDADVGEWVYPESIGEAVDDEAVEAVASAVERASDDAVTAWKVDSTDGRGGSGRRVVGWATATVGPGIVENVNVYDDGSLGGVTFSPTPRLEAAIDGDDDWYAASSVRHNVADPDETALADAEAFGVDLGSDARRVDVETVAVGASEETIYADSVVVTPLAAVVDERTVAVDGEVAVREPGNVYVLGPDDLDESFVEDLDRAAEGELSVKDLAEGLTAYTDRLIDDLPDADVGDEERGDEFEWGVG